ncbi:MarR family winged helix-turn-helix transcriptional regulator [Metabacillus litoralis]|uniref:MarR family winged helix-turn-helix transcriptional regulator n=1 Tax=Metabacillus litoralis TaxID=152268 RepID=UPI00203A3A20|nr:MarR family transcriptional regulator [Metabacillus litoralis]MCM3411850.1 MarR family transcriptional regulator [Metabacillus litoralis]
MKLDNAVGFIVNSTGRNLVFLLNHGFNKFGITAEQWTIIKRLEELEGITPKELSIQVEKDQGNVTRICELLLNRGIIKKESNLEDKRSVLIFLTDEGKDLAKKLTLIHSEMQNIAMQNVNKEEYIIFNKVMSQINENINKYRNSNVNHGGES